MYLCVYQKEPTWFASCVVASSIRAASRAFVCDGAVFVVLHGLVWCGPCDVASLDNFRRRKLQPLQTEEIRIFGEPLL